MEVFNKIYSQVSSSVSSTVSQLSGVLPGNPVTREFDASSHIASGGPGLLWKIYKGVKRSTKQEASIFVFEKRQLEKFNKSDRELILESLKRGIVQLTKIRHPQILTVQHPLEESRESLAFATEPVFASLANILGQTINMPQPANFRSDYKLFDVEIKYGLLQIGEGLAFLHNDMKLLHRNICPESIIINAQGVWKIFGFDFCCLNSSLPNSPAVYPCDGFNQSIPFCAQPNLEYLAPEFVLTQINTPSSDIYSLGMLAYCLHSVGGQVISPAKDLQQFRKRADQLKTLNNNKLQCLPELLREYIKLMLNNNAELRPDAHQFIKIPYFDDVAIKTLTYLDSLLQWDNLQKSQFYKGLPEALVKLPHRVQIQRVLNCLARDLAQPAMIPFVLPSILDIAANCSKEEFVKFILPYIKPVMKLIEPIQILLIFLQRMELLLKLTPAEDVQQHVLPMLYRGLDCDTPQIHELCLSVLPTFAGLLDHSNVKNSLLPRIKKLCLSTSSLSVRVNCLLCVGRLLEHLDKWLVLDEILPFLPQIPSREPAVLMGILGIYKLALNHKKLGISKEIIATRILPFLMPLCIENGLTLSQFNALVALVKQMFQLVENEHRTKLEQLNTVKEEQKVLESTMPVISPPPKAAISGDLDQAFNGLGLESFAMSLQEKQKLVKQQDTMNLLKNQPALEPKPVANNKNSSSLSSTTTITTKDLTSLLDSPPKMEKPFNALVNNNLMTSPSSASTYVFPSPSPASNNNHHNMNLSQNPWGNNGNNTMPMMGMNNSFSSSSSSSYKQASAKTGLDNWSSLDFNLLPSQQNKVPMNQMASGVGGNAASAVKQPLLGLQPASSSSLTSPSSSSTTPSMMMSLSNNQQNRSYYNNYNNKNANNKLSNEEIMDLLS